LNKWIKFVKDVFRIINENKLASLFIGTGVLANIILRVAVVMVLVLTWPSPTEKPAAVVEITPVVPTQVIEPTLTPTSTAVPICRGTNNQDDPLNIRKEPSIEAEILATVMPDSNLEIVDQEWDWLKTDSDLYVNGWVYAPYVTLYGDCDFISAWITLEPTNAPFILPSATPTSSP
jgi:hypothetical protein